MSEWQGGTDPIQRWLRILTALVCLAVFVYLAISPDSGLSNLPTLALALGSVMLLLGYESIVKLPYLKPPAARRKRPPEDEE